MTRVYEAYLVELSGLQQALIAGIYLLSLVSVPCSLSAPAYNSQMESKKNSQPEWQMPCGFVIPPLTHSEESTEDPDLIEKIITQAKIANTSAASFKEDFAQKLFQSSLETLHNNWKETNYTWLPQLPKRFNEFLQEKDFPPSLDNALINTYHELQKIAVGLEQVIWDYEGEGAEFQNLMKNFNESKRKLMLLLCEIQTAIYERNVNDKMEANVSRDIMPDSLRNLNNRTDRNLRDWIIYREYMNVVEYVIEVFEYLKNQL